MDSKLNDKETEDYHILTLEILSMLNDFTDKRDTIKRIVKKVKRFTGFDAVAIRLKSGRDFTYYCKLGFEDDFIEKEDRLCNYDKNGRLITDDKGTPILECLCGCVINKSCDYSYSFFTKEGSFWTNSLSQIKTRQLQDIVATTWRGSCVNSGYESLALIPISNGRKNIGLLQLNHMSKGAFTHKSVNLLEKIGNSIGIIVKRKELEDKIKDQEEKLERERIKTKFFASLSHELKTPLNLIFSAVQLLEKRKENKREHRYCRIIRQNANRLLRMVNNMLDITRINANYFQLNLQNCNIVDLIREITESVRDHVNVKERKLKFISNIKHTYIACDPARIERVMLNLLSNAIKFTNEGDTITVTVSRDRSNKLCISVKDTGIGMKKEKINQVFEEFRQVDESPIRTREGAGLGLPIVKSLVEMHGGEIDLKSQYGEGTEFIIHLPIETVSEERETNKYNYEIMFNQIEKELSDIYT